MAWVEQQLIEKTKGPRSSTSPFQRAFVQNLLAVLEYDELTEALKFLNARRVDFDWIEAVDAMLDEAVGSGD